MSDLNLKPYDPLYPMRIHPYEELLKDQNASVMDKINSIIDYLNSVGKLTNDVVKNWNTVYNWTMNDGLKTGINNKLEDMLAKGEFDPIINTVVTKIGDITTLTTTDKTNLTKAINELVSKIGDLTTLTTPQKDTIVHSINSLQSEVTTNTNSIATNTANIATNTTNIASNASQLADIVHLSNFPRLTVETDDTARIQRAINSISSGFVLLGNQTFNISSLTMKTGVFLFSVNATLKLINNAPVNNIMLMFYNVSNSGVLGILNLDGNRSNQTDTGQEGIKIMYGAFDLYFDTLIVKNTSEDGIYIGGTTTPQPQNIHIKKALVDNAGRNGISITSGQDIFLGDIVTRNTTGNAPQDGVDVETNLSTDVLKNINFESLTTYGNGGDGLQIYGKDWSTTLSHGGVTVKRLNSHNNGNGLQITGASFVSILSGECFSNTNVGMLMDRDVRHIRANLNVFLNGGRGIDMVMSSQNVQSFDIDLAGCRVYNNSRTTPNSVDGVRIDSDDAAKLLSRVYLDEVSLYDDQATHTQRYGITTGANTERIRVTGDIYGNASGSSIINGVRTRIFNYEQSGALNMGTQSVLANSTLNVDITANGVYQGMNVFAAPYNALPAGIIYTISSPSTNIVRITLANLTAGTISVPSNTWRFDAYA